ncbi:MAG: substrate-binding domain-containing protein [Blastococcus sp.]
MQAPVGQARKPARCSAASARCPRTPRRSARACSPAAGSALGVLQEMVRHGFSVPGDLAIVGYDDIDFAAAAAVPLSSVRKPRYELGRRAAELLLEEASPDSHRHQPPVLEPELVVRESSMVRQGREGAA